MNMDLVAKNLSNLIWGGGNSIGTIECSYLPHRDGISSMNDSFLQNYAPEENENLSKTICHIRVASEVLSEIFTQNPTAHFILKIDVEGAEYEIMRDIAKHFPQAVVPIEKVQVIESAQTTHITLPQDVIPNQHIRLKGEEIALDSVILPRYTRLKPLDLGLLASQGLNTISVCKKLPIALFSSGDEVIEPGTKALPHQIYNTNAISIDSILSQYHHKADYLGILPDNKSKLLTRLQNLKQYSVVITTGGASVGDADMLKSTLSELGGEFLFDGVNVKPGKHLSIAILEKSVFIMLPGNPLASLLHLYTIVLSILEFLSGAKSCFLKSQYASADSKASLANGVQKIILGRLQNGEFHIFNRGKFGSSALINVWKNNALAILNEQYDTIQQNDKLACITFDDEFEEECRFIND